MNALKILRALPIAYFVIAIDPPKFTILEGSDYHINSLGLTRDAVIGNGIFELFPDNEKNNYNSADRLFASFMHVVEQKTSHVLILQYDVPILGTDKFEVRHWAVHNYPYFEDEKLLYILNVAMDMTAGFK